MNGFVDGESDDSAECNSSGLDGSGVEDHRAWRRAGKECTRAMALRELRREQGGGDVRPGREQKSQQEHGGTTEPAATDLDTLRR